MSLTLDLRHALRGMRRRPGVTLATVLTLGLGIGTAATMYGVVDEVLLRPLPVRQEHRVVVAWGAFQASGFGHVPLSYPTLTAVRDRSRVFEQLAAVDYNGAWSVVGRTGGEPVPLRIGVVAGDLFPVLGVSPTLGRVLAAEDDRVGAAPAAVISEGLWRRRFGAIPQWLGRSSPSGRQATPSSASSRATSLSRPGPKRGSRSPRSGRMRSRKRGMALSTSWGASAPAPRPPTRRPSWIACCWRRVPTPGTPTAGSSRSSSPCARCSSAR